MKMDVSDWIGGMVDDSMFRCMSIVGFVEDFICSEGN